LFKSKKKWKANLPDTNGGDSRFWWGCELWSLTLKIDTNGGDSYFFIGLLKKKFRIQTKASILKSNIVLKYKNPLKHISLKNTKSNMEKRLWLNILIPFLGHWGRSWHHTICSLEPYHIVMGWSTPCHGGVLLSHLWL